MTTPTARSRLRDPIYIPRWALLGFYGFLVALAVATIIRGSATLDLTQPESYTPIWSAAVGGGALVAAIGTAWHATASFEKWGAAWCAGWLGFLAYQAFDVANGSGWLIVTFFALVPASRAVALFSGRYT